VGAGAAAGFSAGADAGGKSETGFRALWQEQATTIRETTAAVRT